MLKLFKIENNMLTLDKEEIRLIKDFRILLERDKGSKGDAQGRKKLQAFKEFAYIHHTVDILSIPNTQGYSKTKTHKFAIRESNLDENWTIDSDIQNAINTYKDLQSDIPTLNILSSLNRGLSTSSEVVDLIVEKMQETITQLLSADINEEEYIENDEGILVPNPNSTDNKLTILTKRLDQILSISSKLPKTIDEISRVTEKVKKEMEDSGKIRGDRQLNNREDPSYIID